ncbi:sodium-coupled monocarboxylate transporter 2 [Plakobranchus ocellatus]|uniref:Sodium-coupled monocarboxylate transporter 2 n=1 Tax=Plakobranchus ocellatus TaxID=259542 RepID=A0AAV3YHY0_9GAST|nr:sodium-coupled monocarboxylate transporter 2 [Plakobranchus ocellatus]
MATQGSCKIPGVSREPIYYGDYSFNTGKLKQFSIADYAIFTAVLVISAGIGFYHAWKDRRKQKLDDYLLAGRSMNPFPVGLSLLASFMSAITLLGTPAEMYNYTTVYFWVGLGYFFVIAGATHIYIPVFYMLGVTSAYEPSGDLLVELKSNEQAKKLGAITTFLDTPVTVNPHKSLNSSKVFLVELKSNEQAKKLGAITTFLDTPVTVSPHKSLNSSKGVIRSRDLRCCTEEEMVEKLSGVTHARRIKVRRGEDKIQTDTVFLTFDSPKPPSRIRAGYLILDVRPYVPLPMRCYKCQRYGHGKFRCKKPAAVCVRCGKGGHVECVRQLWLNSIKRFQHEHLLVPSRPSFERSQQRSPRMATEVPLLPRPRGKNPERFTGSQSPESSRN